MPRQISAKATLEEIREAVLAGERRRVYTADESRYSPMDASGMFAVISDLLGKNERHNHRSAQVRKYWEVKTGQVVGRPAVRSKYDAPRP